MKTDNIILFDKCDAYWLKKKCSNPVTFGRATPAKEGYKVLALFCKTCFSLPDVNPLRNFDFKSAKMLSKRSLIGDESFEKYTVKEGRTLFDLWNKLNDREK
jgi:hypothetical protein